MFTSAVFMFIMFASSISVSDGMATYQIEPVNFRSLDRPNKISGQLFLNKDLSKKPVTSQAEAQKILRLSSIQIEKLKKEIAIGPNVF